MPNEQPMDPDGVAKIQREWMPNDGMLTLGISSRNVGASQTALRVQLATLDGAIDLGIAGRTGSLTPRC